MPKTDIYQFGEEVSIVTTSDGERDFVDGFTEAYNALIKGGDDLGWGDGRGGEVAVERLAMAAAFDIICKYRGYKTTNVRQRTIMAAGRWPHPSEEPLSTSGSDDPEPELKVVDDEVAVGE